MVSRLEALVNSPQPIGTEFFTKTEMGVGIALPAQLLNQLREKSLTLIILTTGDQRIAITTAPMLDQDQAFEKAKRNPNQRGNIIENAYLTIYIVGQSQDWSHCFDIFNQTYSILSRLAEAKLIKIPASLQIIAREIVDSGYQISNSKTAQEVLKALGDCLIQNGYFGRTNKLAQLGYIPENFR